jgi:hypothetical protein
MIAETGSLSPLPLLARLIARMMAANAPIKEAGHE